MVIPVIAIVSGVDQQNAAVTSADHGAFAVARIVLSCSKKQHFTANFFHKTSLLAVLFYYYAISVSCCQRIDKP